MGLPCCRTGRTSPSCLLWDGWIFVLTLNTKKKKKCYQHHSHCSISAFPYYMNNWRYLQGTVNFYQVVIHVEVDEDQNAEDDADMKSENISTGKLMPIYPNLKQMLFSAPLSLLIDWAIKYMWFWSWYKLVTLKQDLHLQVYIHHPWLVLKTNIKNMN